MVLLDFTFYIIIDFKHIVSIFMYFQPSIVQRNLTHWKSSCFLNQKSVLCHFTQASNWNFKLQTYRYIRFIFFKTLKNSIEVFKFTDQLLITIWQFLFFYVWKNNFCIETVMNLCKQYSTKISETKSLVFFKKKKKKTDWKEKNKTDWLNEVSSSCIERKHNNYQNKNDITPDTSIWSSDQMYSIFFVVGFISSRSLLYCSSWFHNLLWVILFVFSW